MDKWREIEGTNIIIWFTGFIQFLMMIICHMRLLSQKPSQKDK